jgi:glycosyltransferase involved in cell wall biosynthesis
MHILQLYKDYYPILGGIENHIKVLAEGLVARGHRSTVLVTNTESQDEIIQDGNLTIIKAARLLHTASTPLSLSMLKHARMLTDVDVMMLHFPYPPADLAALCVPGKPPLIVRYHSDIVRQQLLLQAYRPLLTWTLKHAARIVTTSPQYITSSPWIRLHADRCCVVPLSVDPLRFASACTKTAEALQSRYGTPIILFVGRLRYYKGLHFLLEAMKLMNMQATLLFVGTGPEEQRLQQQARDTGLSKRIHFLGDVSDADLPALYKAANVFVLPSHLRSEAFGLVQLEAQSAGLPIVCTEIGTGTSYITQHGQTGFVVPPADPPALARAMDVLLANPDLACHMGRAGQSRALTMSHMAMVEHMEHVCKEAFAAQDSRT